MGAGLDLFARRKDGSEFPVNVLLSPVQVPDSEIVISVVRDITDRKTSERDLKERAEQLAHSNQELEQFAYVASHDLQEPLRAVASSCQVMQRRLSGKLDEDTDEFLHFAVDGAKRMQELINDLLTFSRVGRNQSFESANLTEVVGHALANLRTQIEDTKAVVRIEPMPKLRCDPDQPLQLFQNLVSNGIKFCKDRMPEIRSSAVESRSTWTISVVDNGIGIPKAYQSKIFIIFQRLHRREQFPGTGIGLAICKKIVESHGGRIWDESEGGNGSAFRFTISKSLAEE